MKNENSKAQKEVDLDQLSEDARQLQERQHSLLLASVSSTGMPESSYAPYYRDELGNFYIFVSELATHTTNLLSNPKCSVLFICDEAETRNIFARERLSYECLVVEISREDEQFENILIKMAEQFGEMIKLLKGLPDFHLLQLKPQQGRYVVGFGKAYDVDPQSGALQHIDPRQG